MGHLAFCMKEFTAIQKLLSSSKITSTWTSNDVTANILVAIQIHICALRICGRIGARDNDNDNDDNDQEDWREKEKGEEVGNKS